MAGREKGKSCNFGCLGGGGGKFVLFMILADQNFRAEVKGSIFWQYLSQILRPDHSWHAIFFKRTMPQSSGKSRGWLDVYCASFRCFLAI